MVTDKELIDLVAGGLKIEAEPFKSVAESLGISEDEIIERIKNLIAEGKVKRFAASVRHQPMGYDYNAMILVRTDEANLDRVGSEISGIEKVSHCYQRAHPDGDPWCVYVMVHEQEKGRLDQTIEKIRNTAGVKEIEVCSSLIELKKTSLSRVTTKLK